MGRIMVYSFGEFRIDADRFEVARAGQALAVEPQVLELLILLLRHRDRVVTRDELLETVWHGRVVSDTTLSSRIKTARQLLGDDGTRQDYIKTIHGRGFRFVGEVAEHPPAAPAPAAPTAPRDRPTTRYARSGEVHVAYQVFGDGPARLVFAPGFVSHIDNYWDSPRFRHWLNGLGRLARVAMFDKRGTGMSDPVGSLPPMDERMDDLRAVMDAAGFGSAHVMGISEGGSLAALFAAHHPERCDGLIVYGGFAQFRHWHPDEASLQRLFDYVETGWGSGKSLPLFAPTVGDDPEMVRWWGQFERLGATPGACIALMRMNSRIDITGVLPGIRVPTLVIHRADDVLISIEAGRQLAAGIPGAHYAELSGVDHLPWVGDSDRIVEEIAEFMRDARPRETPERAVATIVLIRVGAEAALLEQALRQHRATRIAERPDGIAATFDGPARALECAVAVSRLLRARGIEHQIGLHTGEISLAGTELEGTAMNISADVAGHATGNEILASRTVHDLVAGSGIALEERGEFPLLSIRQGWQLYRIVT